MKYLFLVFSLLLFFGGCEDKFFYKVYDETVETKKIKELSILSNNKKVFNEVVELIENKNIKITQDSQYTIDINYSFYKECKLDYKNVAYGNAYNGYIRISLYKNEKEILLIQKEFRDSLPPKELAKIIDKIFS